MELFTNNWEETFGYLAPVFIVLSMMQQNLTYVRIFMILGCITFIIYGYLIDAMPVVVANALICSVTTFYLLKPKKA
jgi:hypothetical protein